MHPKSIKIIILFIISTITFSAEAVIEDCERKVNFSNGNTYKNISGTINCVQRKNPRIKTQSVTLKNGKKHGKSITYVGRYGRENSTTNNIAMIENYREDKKHGKYIIYDEKNPSIIKTEREYNNGLLIREMDLIPYSGSKRTNYYQIYAKKGQTKTKKRSRKIGSLTYNKVGQLQHKNCPKKASTISKLNKVCGFNGNSQKVSLRDERGNITASAVINKGQTEERKTFYSSGKLRSKASATHQQLFYENGKLQEQQIKKADGSRTIQKYYSNGTKHNLERIVDNYLIEERTWFMNGKLKYVASLQPKNGRKSVKKYYGDGKPQIEYTTIRNTRGRTIFIGLSRSFYQNGKTKKESNYNHQGKLLNEKIFFENGNLMKFIQVASDDSRTVKEYNKKGVLEKMTSYFSDGSVK